MDTTQDRKRKSEELENGLQTSSLANTTGNLENDDLGDSIVLNGEVIEVAPDLKILPELDENDPDVRRWMEEEEKRYREKYPNITREEAYAQARNTEIDTSWTTDESN